MIDAPSVYPYLHIVPWLCALAVHLVPAAMALLAATTLARLVRHARAARRLDARAPDTEVTIGRTVVLHGIVEAPAPVTVDITQQREPHPRDPEELAWVESRRAVTAVPFPLVLASGARLRIEADGSTTLVGPPLQTVAIDERTRLRRAQLVAGDTATVEGTVATGTDPTALFRGAVAPVLRGPGLTIWTIAPGEPHRRRAIAHGVTLGVIAVLLTVAALFSAGPLRLRWSGVPVTAEIIDLGIETQRSSEGDDVRHILRARILPGQPGAGRIVTEEIWASDYRRLRRGMHLSARVVPRAPATARLGEEPTFPAATLVPLLMGLIVALVLVVRARRHQTGWWEPPLVEGR